MSIYSKYLGMALGLAALSQEYKYFENECFFCWLFFR